MKRMDRRCGLTLLQLALRRAERAAGRGRVSVVVAPEHRQWWEEDLRGYTGASVVVQPHNRGTAAGVLLPLTTVCGQDRDTTVFILPSDHWVADERILTHFRQFQSFWAVRFLGKTRHCWLGVASAPKV